MNDIYKNYIHGNKSMDAMRNQFNMDDGQIMPSKYEEYLISKKLYETYHDENFIYRNFK